MHSNFRKFVLMFVSLMLTVPTAGCHKRQPIQRSPQIPQQYHENIQEIINNPPDEKWLTSGVEPGHDQSPYEPLEYFLEHRDDPDVMNMLYEDVSGDDVLRALYANSILFKLGDKQESRVDFLINALETMMGTDIQRAQGSLKEMFEPGDDPVFCDQILTLRSHPNPWNRQTIIWAATRFPDYQPAHDFIMEMVDDSDLAVRSAAIGAMGEVAGQNSEYSNDPEVMSKLMSLLQEDDITIQASVCMALGNFGYREDTANVLYTIVAEEVPDVSNYAIEALVEILPNDEALVYLRGFLNSHDNIELNRSMLFDLVLSLGTGDDVLDVVIECMGSEYEYVSHAAMLALADFDQDNETIVPLMIEKMESNWNDLPQDISQDGVYLRTSPMRILGEMGPAAEDAIPALGSILKSDLFLTDPGHPEYIRMTEAIKAMWRIGGSAEDYLPRFLEIAQESEGILQLMAVDVIGEYGNSAEFSVPALLAMVDGNEGTTLEASIRLALYKIGYDPEEQVESLIAALDGEDKVAAAKALGYIGPPASDALPRLRDLADRYESNEEIGLILTTFTDAVRQIEGISEADFEPGYWGFGGFPGGFLEIFEQMGHHE